MARVTFKEGQPIQALSGRIGRLVFQTRNGKTFVHEHLEPELPADANRKAKAKFRRMEMVQNCVTILQEEMSDISEALKQRKKIQERISRLYDKYVKNIKAKTKLQRRIIEEYRAHYQQVKDNDSMMDR